MLASRAAKKAAEGLHEQAVQLLDRSLTHDPAQNTARRDLAMVHQELKNLELAKLEVIRSIALDCTDHWSMVVYANHLIKFDGDFDRAEKWLHRALEIQPDDAWALNSLGALLFNRGRFEEGETAFRRVIDSSPTVPNPYVGLAIALHRAEKHEEASVVIREMMVSAKARDTRDGHLFQEARSLYATCQERLASRYVVDCERVVEEVQSQLESQSGFPIIFGELPTTSSLGAKIEIAWRHRREEHRLLARANFPRPLLEHLKLHELMHLDMEVKARSNARNRSIFTSATTREEAKRSLRSETNALRKQGLPVERMEGFLDEMVEGLIGFLFNYPLDMIIESRLRSEFPEIRPAQYVSVTKLALEAWSANSSPEVRRITPAPIMRGSLALNGAYALFLDELLHPVSDLSSNYRPLKTFPLSQSIYECWKQRQGSITAGDEYDLVDEFADLVGVMGWYGWMPDVRDPMTEDDQKRKLMSAVSLEEYHGAAMWYLLGALKLYKDMSTEEVRKIAFEIGMLGTTGLDYVDAEQKYSLRSIPGKKFTGLQLMCYMFVGFKILEPELDSGIDLEKPYQEALAMMKLGM